MGELRDEEKLRADVDGALVDELYLRARASMTGLAFVLVLLRVFLNDVFPRSTAVRATFYVFLGAFALRIVHLLVARRATAVLASTRARHLSFAVGSTSTALCISALNLAAYPHLDAGQFASLAVCNTGITAVALVSLGGSPLLYHLYMLPILVPLIGVSAVGPLGAGMRFLPVMMTLYCAVLSAMSLHEHRLRHDNVVLRLRVGEMALIDSLTRLRNRRFLLEFMAVEVERVLRDWFRDGGSKPRLCLMMVDLDHFKAVNDKKGHAAGDAVLAQLGALLRDTVRTEDVVARWGGEEFVVVARDRGEDGGATLAERLRRQVAAHRFVLPSGETIALTCSVGFSVYPFVAASPRSLDWAEVLSLADAALYRAKSEGRNRAVGILSGEEAASRAREAMDEAKSDVMRARESGLVRLVG